MRNTKRVSRNFYGAYYAVVVNSCVGSVPNSFFLVRQPDRSLISITRPSAPTDSLLRSHSVEDVLPDIPRMVGLSYMVNSPWLLKFALQ